jgi:hypothetical protein
MNRGHPLTADGSEGSRRRARDACREQTLEGLLAIRHAANPGDAIARQGEFLDCAYATDRVPEGRRHDGAPTAVIPAAKPFAGRRGRARTSFMTLAQLV